MNNIPEPSGARTHPVWSHTTGDITSASVIEDRLADLVAKRMGSGRSRVDFIYRQNRIA